VLTFTRDEHFWLNCDVPFELFRMFELLGDARRARFWFVGCCRLVSGQLSRVGQSALDTAERFADDRATAYELSQARAVVAEELAAVEARLRLLDDELFAQCVDVELGRAEPDSLAGIRTRITGAQHRREAANRVAAAIGPDLRLALYSWYGLRSERRAMTALLRCVFPNPFRLIHLDPAWRTDTVVAIARGVSETRDFSALPILADALQDAGCDSDDVLDHCRGAGPHTRGCWVCDLVLGNG
jgi:hypothetical protein